MTDGEWMTGLLLIASFMAFVVGGYHYMSALLEVRPYLAAQFQEEVSTRWILDSAVWGKSIPASARRKYLMSLVCGTLFTAGLTVLMLMNRPPFGALLFVALLVLSIVHTLRSWSKYRATDEGAERV